MLTVVAGVVMTMAAGSTPVGSPVPRQGEVTRPLLIHHLTLARLDPVLPDRSPRLQFRERPLRDPQQFAALRAMPVERGGFRGSPINAKVEWRLSGDLGGVDSQVGVSGIPRMITRALLR